MFRRIVVTCLFVSLVGSAVVVEAEQLYGAIAYAKGSGRYGYIAGVESRQEAQDEALEACNSSGCEIQVWFRNACGALAVDKSGRVTGWGWASSQAEAERRALGECRKRGERCRVIVATCAQPGASNQSGSGRLR